MKLKYFLALIIVFVFSSMSVSQDIKKSGGFARITSMGANPYIIDPFFMITNPAWGSEYDHFLMGDIGASAGAPFSAGGVGQFFSLNFGLSNNFTIGAFLTRNSFNGLGISTVDPLSNFPGLGIVPGGILGGGGGVVQTLNTIIGTTAAIPMDNNFEAFATMSFGRTSIGLGVAYTGTTNETPFGATGTNLGSASQLGINVGLLTNLTSSFMLDVGASILFPSASFEPGAQNSNTSEVSQTIIGVNGRLFMKLSNKVWLVPIVNFATVSGTQENGQTPQPTSSDLPSLTLLTVGVGINYVVGDFLLAGGPSLSSISLTRPSTINTPELSTSVFSFPVWNIGVEWNLLEWLTGRLGYVAVTSKVTNEGVVGGTLQEPQIGETIATVYPIPVTRGITLGVGLHFGDFTLDATVNEDVLRQGFSNIGGGGQAGATFAYLSASYAIPK